MRCWLEKVTVMFTKRMLSVKALVIALFALTVPAALAQETPPSGSQVQTVEISPARVEAVAGQKLKFTATGKDASGKAVDMKAAAWFALPSDRIVVDDDGTVTFFGPGEAKLGAFVGGKLGVIKFNVKPAPATRIEIDALPAPLVVKGTAQLNAVAHTFEGNPRSDAVIGWTSETPAVAMVDAAGVVTGVAPGKATVRATSEGASGTVMVEVMANTVRSLSVEPSTAKARTGDVVRFTAKSQGGATPSVRWAVSGEGVVIEADGGLVAERPGTYIVTATSGEQTAAASVVVAPRNVEREIKVVGRAAPKDFQAAEQWIFGNYAYLASVSDKLLVFDISDPARPKQTDTVTVDTHIINDVSVSADGKTGVITREGASNRKNGIMFLDTSDPAHPKVLSEYTETVTGGVHSAFIDGHYVYLTDDSTGSLRVIDFSDVKAPKEVARWQTESPLVTTGGFGGGRYIHDVQVKDGLAYLAHWRDGIVVLDVGNGLKGGSPSNPKFVSQLRFNYHELYGNGWIAGAHAVFRYKNYLFVGDEVFPEVFDISSKQRIPVRGIVHVLDVSDINRPRKVAEYGVPESGAHNIWVENDILYMGYYNGGGRVLDVSGELRGNLYNQGREIGRLWTGDMAGFRPNLPFAWGAQPHKDMVFFNDMNSGLWIVKLGEPKEKGSTTAPGN